MDDVALVQQATSLDKDAFGAVYERYATRLYDYLWWVLQDREEATYALYDTFLEAGARLPELKDPSKLRPWLFAIASDQALRHRRKAEGRLPEAPPAPEADAAWGELKQVVLGIATDLSPQDRALLDLRYRQRLEDDELAEAVGTTPERAVELLDPLTARVEAVLGETVVAFLARRDCPDLTDALGPWDERLDARQREIVEEHAASCPTCSARRQRHIPASSLLGVSPAMAVPGGVAEKVLEDVELASRHSRLPFTGRRNGFPPPLIGYRHRQRLGIGAAAVAVILVLAIAGYIVSRGGGTQEVASTGSSTVPSTTIRSSTSLTTFATTTTLVPPLGDPAAVSIPGAVTGGTGSATTRPAASGGGGGGGGNTNTTAAPADTTVPASSNTTTPTTAPPPTSPPTTADTTPPTISVSVSPSTVRAGSKCTNGDPTTATVTANVTDASGVASVRLVAAGLDTMNVAMSPTSGGNYTATVGPFQSPLPAGNSLDLPVVVQATDTVGNKTNGQGTITLRCTA